MDTNNRPAKLTLLARLATAPTTAHFKAALNAWHDARYGPVPGWALDVQIRKNPPTWEDLRRFLEGE
jgi:hypothetical protein